MTQCLLGGHCVQGASAVALTPGIVSKYMKLSHFSDYVPLGQRSLRLSNASGDLSLTLGDEI